MRGGDKVVGEELLESCYRENMLETGHCGQRMGFFKLNVEELK